MDEHRVTELLQLKSAEVSGKTRFCPDGELIAKYFEGTLDGKSRLSLKRHVVDCRYCQAQIGNQGRLSDKKDYDDVPGSVLANAKSLVRPQSKLPLKYAGILSAAAMVVVAVTVGLVQGPQSNPNSAAVIDEFVSPQPTSQLRSIDRSASIPMVISPADGENIKPGTLDVRWTEVLGSLYYNIQVVNAEGFILWRDRVEGTSWTPPPSDLLKPGMDYFVRVDAYLAEANNVSSEHILFTVGEPEE
jgi:hypothetical protein